MLRVTIGRYESELKRHVWEFELLTGFANCDTIVVNSSTEESKLTKRHHWKIMGRWNRLDRRNSTIGLYLPGDVVTEARESLAQQVKNLPVSEHFGGQP
jgi:hypothetical protein